MVSAARQLCIDFLLGEPDALVRFRAASFPEEMTGMSISEAASTAVQFAYYGYSDALGVIVQQYPDMSDFSVVRVDDKSWNLVSKSSVGVVGIELNSDSALHAVLSSIDLSNTVKYSLASGLAGLAAPEGGKETLISTAFSACRLDGAILTTSCDDIQSGVVLPTFRRGVLEMPELVIALSQASPNGVPYARQSVLFYADPDMIRLHSGDIEPMAPLVQISASYTVGGAGRVSAFKPSEFTASAFSLPAQKDGTLNEGLEGDWCPHLCTWGVTGADGNLVLTGSQLRALIAYGSEEVKLGLEVPEGLVLCAADHSFLASIPIQEISLSMLGFATKLVEKISDDHLIIADELLSQGKPFATAWVGAQVLDSLVSKEFGDIMFNSIPLDFWRRYYFKQRLQGELLLKFSDKFPDVLYEGLGIMIDYDDACALQADDYSFPEYIEAEVSWNDDSSEMLLDTTRMLLSLPTPPPIIDGFPTEVGADEIMDRISGGVDSIEYQILKHAAGKYDAGEIASRATSTDHWNLVVDVFDRDDYEVYIPQMPKKIKARLVLEDFNI